MAGIVRQLISEHVAEAEAEAEANDPAAQEITWDEVRSALCVCVSGYYMG
jgi:hypothetical protein